MLKTKLFASAVAFTMVFSLVAVPASAQTTAELTAQINALLAQIAQLQAQIGGSTVGGSTTTFTTDLTVGSTGAHVTALQQFLVSKGFLTMPAGVAYGYFGTLTQSALGKYQASVGISPAAGYFGPITRAHVNGLAGTPGTPGTPTTPGGAGITTPGVEGTLTVTSNNSGLVSTAYEGDSMIGVLGLNVEAKLSDIAIQRVKIQLGSASTLLWRKGYSKLYVTDGSNTLASIDLNSSTVVKEGSDYFVTITGFNFVVPKDSKKQMVIKADVMSSIDSTDRTNLGNEAMSIVVNGVRGIDGAGIDQYSPAAAISRTTSFSAELAENATLKVSLNNSSPKAQEVVAADGSSDNELDKLTMLMIDFKAEKDDVTLTDLTVDITYSGSGTATVTTVYLFDGSTEIDNASSNGVAATFTDLDYVISKDTTKTLTVKADVRSADGTVRTITFDVDTADVTAENSMGDSITESGSAAGYAMSVRNVGLEISLVSKSITTSGVPQLSSVDGFSTSTLTATFNVKVKAVGNDVVLGAVGSSTAPLFSTSNFKLYRNGVLSSANVATSTSFTIPSTCTTISGQNSCTLAEGSEVTIPVTFQIPGRTAASAALTSGIYAVGLEGATWGVTQNTSTFMAGELDWRTSEVSFP